MAYKKKNNRPPRPGEGRPKATLNDLPPAWKSIILSGSLQGKFESEIRADIVLSRGKKTENIVTMWYALKGREVEFSETLKIALIFRKAYFEKLGRKALKSRYFKEHTWQSIMKNCFGYVDKMEVEHGITDDAFEKYKSLSPKEIDQKLAEYTKANRILEIA